MCVCPVYAERSEQMTGMTVRTCAMGEHTETHTAQSVERRAPKSTQLGNAASCVHQYGQQLFVQHLQHIAKFL